MNKQSHAYFEYLIKALQENTCLATVNNKTTLDKIKNKNLVIYFYPKDNTPGCTQESKDFASDYVKFANYETEIIGISRDSIESHHNFKEKYKLPFELISDPDGIICNFFKTSSKIRMLGIERTTFLFNKQGLLVHEWRKVKVKNHINDILSKLNSLEN